MRAVKLIVSVTGKDERGDRLDSSREEPQNVERRLVRPVDVLEDEDGSSSSAQLACERRDDFVRPGLARDDLAELPARALRDGKQRTKRSGREERIAVAPQDSRRRTALFAEAAQECRLPHTSFATDEHDPASCGALDRVKRFFERCEFARTLEQLARFRRSLDQRDLPCHARIVPRASRWFKTSQQPARAPFVTPPSAVSARTAPPSAAARGSASPRRTRPC